MNAIDSQITGFLIVYSPVCSGADQRKYKSSASLAFVWGIHPMNFPHKGLVTRKMFSFDDVIMDVWHLEEALLMSDDWSTYHRTRFSQHRFMRQTMPGVSYDWVSNHRQLECLLNSLFALTSAFCILLTFTAKMLPSHVSSKLVGIYR